MLRHPLPRLKYGVELSPHRTLMVDPAEVLSRLEAYSIGGHPQEGAEGVAEGKEYGSRSERRSARHAENQLEI